MGLQEGPPGTRELNGSGKITFTLMQLSFIIFFKIKDPNWGVRGHPKGALRSQAGPALCPRAHSGPDPGTGLGCRAGPKDLATKITSGQNAPEAIFYPLISWGHAVTNGSRRRINTDLSGPRGHWLLTPLGSPRSAGKGSSPHWRQLLRGKECRDLKLGHRSSLTSRNQARGFSWQLPDVLSGRPSHRGNPLGPRDKSPTAGNRQTREISSLPSWCGLSPRPRERKTSSKSLCSDS